MALTASDPTFSHQCLKCGCQYRGHSERCWTCGESGWVTSTTFRPATALRPARGGMTARQLASYKKRLVSFPSVPELKIGKSALVAITGEPGKGKTTLIYKLAGDCRPAILFPFEEGFGETVCDRCRRLELIHDDLYFELPGSVSAFLHTIDRIQPAFVGVDSLSVSQLTVGDLAAVAQSKRIVVAFTNHLRKDGQVEGKSGVAYESDVVIRMTGEPGEWKLVKSRYQELTSGRLEALC